MLVTKWPVIVKSPENGQVKSTKWSYLKIPYISEQLSADNLKQFTAGDVKELVRSCHHLPAEGGYDEACRLLRRKNGDDYRIASA